MNLTPDAQLRLDLYMTGVRRAVAGTSIDPAEVERDIREHIDSALRETDAPVSRATLDEVLARLGDPGQWVPDEEIPAWRRVWRRVAYGPEEWRLPYLSFASFVLGLVLLPVGVGIVFLIAAWVMSRAALHLPSMQPESDRARKWLLYPPLAFFAILFALLIVAGAAVPLIAWGVGNRGVLAIFDAEWVPREEQYQLYAGWVLASFAAWWIVLAPLVAVFIRPVRWLFAPFANRLRRAHAILLAAAGAVLGIAAALVLGVLP